MIQPHNWLMMLQLVPEELRQLTSTCYEYEELMAYLESATKINGREIGKIQILIQRVMTEYLKIIQLKEKEKETIEKIRTDMEATMSNWFDNKGNMKDLSQAFLMSMERGQLGFHLPLFATPSIGFIHSRVYQSLVEAYKTAYEKPLFQIEKLGHFIPEKYWGKLSKKMHPALCFACRDFENYAEHAMRIYPYHAKKDEGFTRYGAAVIEEYLKIVGSGDKILDDLESIGDMIAFVHSIYYYLDKARVKHDGAFINTFVTSTKYKAGIYPAITRDGKDTLGIKLPKGPSGPEEN